MGARESNAGDDFHFWWAATRVLELVQPEADRVLITIEGLSRVDDPVDEYEAIDITEYVGGDDLGSASLVVLSQLKHSTRHPDRAWTASRLCEVRKRRDRDGRTVSSRSVIADLAGAYAQLHRGRSREQLRGRVRISLVSNQPGDETVLAAVAAAAEWARKRPARAGKAALLTALPEPHREVIARFGEAVGGRLGSGDFCDFLTVLDLSQTGTLGRAALVRGIRMGAAELTPGRGPDSAQRLFELVRGEALPESGRAGIRAWDVLAALGVADVVDLYPAPVRLPPLADPLPAPGAVAIAEAARTHPGGVVVAHGAAGVGKTTALRQVADHLPSGSVVELFDCYGGGEYLSSGEERHTPQRFVLQVVNDLARQCGTPLLVNPPNLDEDLWRRLRRTLEKAVEALDPDGVLVLAVDAADNARFAADQRGDRGFLPGLLALPLPSRVTVVLAARSHRVESLDAPNATQVELTPFTRAVSAAHLRRYRPDATDTDATEFHELTAGNPRTQYYALARAADGRDMPSVLELCKQTPEALFEELVDSALQVCSADAGGQRWLALMLALDRPVSTATLGAALNVELPAVAAFAQGLTPGVTVVDGTIQFRDEDFENYVRDRVAEADVTMAHNQLADMFLAARTTDPEAAAHVADHLFDAGRFDEVLRLVLDEDWPEAIPDGFRRGQVQGRRLDLAARAAAQTDNAAAAVQLAVRACETASRLNTLSVLVESRLDMVARYTDVDLLREQALRQLSRRDWLAPVHMRLAALLARDPARHDAARDELERADAWLRRWSTSADEETRHWQVDADDVAYAAEARYHLYGAEAAIAWLRRWRPPGFALDAATALAARVAADVGPATVRNLLSASGVPVAAQAPFLAHAVSSSAPPDRAWVDEVVSGIVGTDPGREQPWHHRLVDIAARHGDRQAAAALARHWSRELPSHRWGFAGYDADGVAALRIRAVASVLGAETVNVDDLVPPALRPDTDGAAEGADTKRTTADDRHAHQRREWTETVKPLWDAALLAARAIVGEANADELATFMTHGLAGRLEKAGHRWFTYDRSYRAWGAIVAEAAVDVGALPEVLNQLVEQAPKLVRDGAPDSWLDLAAVLVRRGSHPDLAADLCRRAAGRAHTYPAQERLELLARATEIAGAVVPELGKRLFDLAVQVASGINDEAARLLTVHADLAYRAAISPMERATVAAQLVQAADAAVPHVTSDGVIPYEQIARAAGRLDPNTALAAVSRWDDQDRTSLTSTLPAALLGAVDGGGIPATHALVLDHLVDDDQARLKYVLAIADRLAVTAGRSTARLALRRTTEWVRRHVPAKAQPALADRLLEWAATRSLDEQIRPMLDPVVRLAHDPPETEMEPRTSRDWGSTEPTEQVKELLANPTHRAPSTLADDVAELTNAYVYGDQLTEFIASVALNVSPNHRAAALEAVAGLPSRIGADTVVPVLATCLREWQGWPGIADWAAATLPTLLGRFLPDLAWRQDTTTLLEQLRALGSDNEIRQAILAALPDARLKLTAFGWQNIAALLGRLCDTTHAATALRALLTDRLPDASNDAARRRAAAPDTDTGDPVVLLLWSTFGHPRRAIRWRAAHATRDLLTGTDPQVAAAFAASFVNCLDRADAGPYRDPSLPFYRFSAAAALLIALARVATNKPAILTPHASVLVRHATSQDLPHAQIRELARHAALAVVSPNSSDAETLRRANEPAAYLPHKEAQQRGNDRAVSDDRRYRFDSMDTIPYWYAPLARIFDLPTDAIAERAERWILDEWGMTEDDWWTDRRELRDQESYRRTSHRHGSIPPEENLRLYLEYHAMFTAAGELIDASRPVYAGPWEDAGDPWHEWLDQHLPADHARWVSDLRSAVPAEPDLFGHLPPLDEWDTPADTEFDNAFGLIDGRLADQALVAGRTSVRRRGAYAQTYVWSALVAPTHAADLQRALAAAPNPTDWKLPDENDEQFEVDHGDFVLRGWLTDPGATLDTLDEHDPYAQGIHPALPLPGQRYRDATGATLDPNRIALRDTDGLLLAHVDQWADPEPKTRDDAVTSSGYRVYVRREALLRHLADTGTILIVEVQIGRHRSNARSDDYRPPRSRIYLIEATGSVTVR